MNWLRDSFTTWPLLIGLLAAAIPFLLHLLSSVKAQEVYFPTLRFLQLSMEKTARRRRIQHWLLLLLRSLLLALLAVGAAEPLSKATGGWLTGRSHASVLILDNSFSMLAQPDAGTIQAGGQPDRTRFARAQREAAELLEGPSRPTLAAVMTTTGGTIPEELTGKIEGLGKTVRDARVGYGPALLAQRVRTAVELLAADSSPQKSIYIFSDMQASSFEEVADLQELARAREIHLLVVDTAGRDAAGNVAVTKTEVEGKYMLNQPVTVHATLVNSSSDPRKFDASVRIEGRGEVVAQDGTLAPAETKVVSFDPFHLDRAGALSGEVFVKLVDGDDALPLDNSRRFSLDVVGGVPVLVVAGPSPPDVPATLGSAGMLELALDPFGGAAESAVGPPEGVMTRWSVSPRTVQADQFNPADLDNVDAAFFCNVPSFTLSQARAMVSFARAGGTVVIFPGPDADVANYNRLLIKEAGTTPVLPGRLTEAVGQVGPTADALRLGWVDTTHPYLAALHEKMGDYLDVRVQRYFRLADRSDGSQTLLRLAPDDNDKRHPLMLTDRCGSGHVVLCTTTASRQWSNLPVSSLFLPMMVRISLLARRGDGGNNTYEAGRQVVIAPRTSASGAESISAGEKIYVFAPDSPGRTQKPHPLVMAPTPRGPAATFKQTEQLGEYRWELAAGKGDKPRGGRFVVNPYGAESSLQTIPPEQFTAALADQGAKRVYVAPTVAQVTQAALADTERARWWDVLLAAAIVVLVVEALVANRRRRRQGDDVIPTHLNPRMAPQHEG